MKSLHPSTLCSRVPFVDRSSLTLVVRTNQLLFHSNTVSATFISYCASPTLSYLKTWLSSICLISGARHIVNTKKSLGNWIEWNHEFCNNITGVAETLNVSLEKPCLAYFFFKKLERLKDTARKQEAWELECDSTEPQLLAITIVLCPVTPHRKAFTQSWRNMFILEPSPNQVLHCCLGDKLLPVASASGEESLRFVLPVFPDSSPVQSMNNEEKALARHR